MTQFWVLRISSITDLRQESFAIIPPSILHTFGLNQRLRHPLSATAIYREVATIVQHAADGSRTRKLIQMNAYSRTCIFIPLEILTGLQYAHR